ncbi:rhomboid family intramembrane serine protease [Hippea sp. KM1]|uniref:rhomboid family intramembrane serine protease n=1 Tax=Hippea sp. KM1 TaxID=944481 RepID=UPI00046CA98A|nr:rhomboid family intramembrane serine protease [Hippea sp. KM1]
MFPLKDNNPSYTRPVVNIFLIVVNVLVFFYELSQPNIMRFMYNHAFIPAMLFDYHYIFSSLIRAFNSMFLHGGFMHIIGNMWFLWVFGDNVEDRLGHVNYLLFYLAGGYASMIVQGAITPHSTVPLIGASGAVSAVLGAYLVFFPHASVLTLLPILIFITFVWIPAWLYIILWFFMQYLNGMFSIVSKSMGGVAWFAHIGGFIFGLIVARIKIKKEYL